MRLSKNKAIFLDRDGTINREVDNLRSVSQLRLLPGTADAICKMQALGFLIIVVTNQPVVGRGWLTEQEVREINDELVRRLAKKGAGVDAVYYCPHHPDATVAKYRKVCDCRKPGNAMMRRGIKQFNIDPKKSFMIGDRTGDILAGKRAKLRTILLCTGYAGGDAQYDVTPDFVAKNLHHAIHVIGNG